MGLRFLVDSKEEIGCMYDSVSDTAFGPVLYGWDTEEKLQSLVEYIEINTGKDARELSANDLSYWHSEWYKNCCDDGGNLLEKPKDQPSHSI